MNEEIKILNETRIKKKILIKKKIKKFRHHSKNNKSISPPKSIEFNSMLKLLNSNNTFDDDFEDDKLLKTNKVSNKDALALINSILHIDEETSAICESLNTMKFPIHEEYKISGSKYPDCSSFPQLILAVTDPNSDMDFQKTFITTFISFTTPERVLASILYRYFADIKVPGCNIPNQSVLRSIQNKIIRIISSQWLKYASYQFTPDMYNALTYFSERVYQVNEVQGQILDASINYVRTEQSNRFKRALPEEFFNRSLCEKPYNLLNLPPIELAKQISVFHNNIFMKILPNELLSGVWGKLKGGNSPNIDALIKHFDGFTMKVAVTIIQGPDPHTRGRIIKRWLDIAFLCLDQYHNYHGAFSIFYALTHKSVQRLTQTQKYANRTNKIRKQQFEILKNLSQPVNDFKPYREEIKKAITPCVPFMGCFQKDLVYVQESYPNYIDNLINFKKCVESVSLLKFLSTFQSWYKIEEVPEIQTLIAYVQTSFYSLSIIKMYLQFKKSK